MLPCLTSCDRAILPTLLRYGVLAPGTYELPGGRLVRAIAHRAAITAVAFGSGSELVSGAVLMTLAGQEPIGRGSAPGGIDAIATLIDGQIAVADARGHVRILDRHGAVVAEIAASARARMLRPSPDGRRVIAVPSYLGKAAPPVLLDVERHELVARLDGPQVHSARWVRSRSRTS